MREAQVRIAESEDFPADIRRDSDWYKFLSAEWMEIDEIDSIFTH